MTTAFVFYTLNKLLPRDAIIAEECPSSKGDLDRYISLDEPGSFYSVRTGILGFALPAAVGLQLADPKRRVVCPVGDGSGAIFDSGVMVGRAAESSCNISRHLQRKLLRTERFCDFTQVGKNVPGIDIPGIDVVKIAQGYGMNARAVDRPEDLESALKCAFASQEPILISVNVQQGGQKTMGMDQSVNPPNYG